MAYLLIRNSPEDGNYVLPKPVGWTYFNYSQSLCNSVILWFYGLSYDYQWSGDVLSSDVKIKIPIYIYNMQKNWRLEQFDLIIRDAQ